jgi:hypothetical protein
MPIESMSTHAIAVVTSAREARLKMVIEDAFKNVSKKVRVHALHPCGCLYNGAMLQILQ